jgi:hypothetical protein
MAQTYSAAHLKVVDERVYLESLTKGRLDNDIRLDFNGKNSVTIYNVNTVAEVDYNRGELNASRFGALTEVGTGVQTLTLSQDKAFNAAIDRGNYEDSQMVTEAASFVKRQVREVIVKNLDVYNLSILTAYAIANSQGSIGSTAVANTTIFSLILVQQAALDELLYSPEGRTLWITPTNYNLLKRDPEFIKACDTSVADLKKGILGEVDGLTIVKVPASFLVAKFEFMITCRNVAVAVNKFNMIRTLDNDSNIDGWLVQGRRYFDCFILGQKATGIRIKTAP